MLGSGLIALSRITRQLVKAGVRLTIVSAAGTVVAGWILHRAHRPRSICPDLVETVTPALFPGRDRRFLAPFAQDLILEGRYARGGITIKRASS